MREREARSDDATRQTREAERAEGRRDTQSGSARRRRRRERRAGAEWSGTRCGRWNEVPPRHEVRWDCVTFIWDGGPICTELESITRGREHGRWTARESSSYSCCGLVTCSAACSFADASFRSRLETCGDPSALGASPPMVPAIRAEKLERRPAALSRRGGRDGVPWESIGTDGGRQSWPSNE